MAVLVAHTGNNRKTRTCAYAPSGMATGDRCVPAGRNETALPLVQSCPPLILEITVLRLLRYRIPYQAFSGSALCV